jgi:hypothetical protein
MATFPSTSADRRARGGWALLLAVLLCGASPLLRAGNLITLTNGSNVTGKLSVAGDAIHAEAESSPPDTPAADVLEATFDDRPFTLSFFDAGTISQLPANWSAQEVGAVITPGSVTVQSGTFTLIGSGIERRSIHSAESGIFVGTPWPDNGQFTARLLSLDTTDNAAWAGLMFRDTLDPKGGVCGGLLTGMGQIRLPARHEARHEDWGDTLNGTAPLWLRLTREGNTILTSMSPDGNDWDTIATCPFKDLTTPLAGLTARGTAGRGAVKAVFDHVSLTPLPSSAQVLPAGVLLQGGSILAGHMDRLNLDPANTEPNADFSHGDTKMPIARSSIAGVIFLPIPRAQFDGNDAKAGLVMRNGDTADGDITQISTDQVSVSSVLLGLTNYKASEVRAVFIAPLQTKSAPLEIRLRDGSLLNATAISGGNNSVMITDVSGVTIPVGSDDIAQIRAGNATVQDLAQLDWKATAPAPANGAAPANPAPPLVGSWMGPDQQQVLSAGMGTAIEFPLPGKFRAFGVQAVISSDSPPNATATIHFLSDGHELAKSPPFHAGDPPRFLELNLPTATHLTLQADSMFPGTKILYLDPVAIR